jgi:hypothetical protein
MFSFVISPLIYPCRFGKAFALPFGVCIGLCRYDNIRERRFDGSGVVDEWNDVVVDEMAKIWRWWWCWMGRLEVVGSWGADIEQWYLLAINHGLRLVRLAVCWDWEKGCWGKKVG